MLGEDIQLNGAARVCVRNTLAATPNFKSFVFMLPICINTYTYSAEIRFSDKILTPTQPITPKYA